MNCKTKYNIGDLIWFMYNNRPLEVEVSRIKIECVKDQLGLHTRVDYMVRFIHSTKCESGDYVMEERFFKTKQELLESL